ncbi:hypothetical protein LGR54_22835 [Ancylobacter sp. Lp-2]|uniref:hypothetical protein n=1 Tax=Ancylobacter sp. Lp-2 TaxID=2881339 RepID=UPI001E60FE43|nr:hypothetical protein [Ancylobacter sp. Lp-2]MCB4771449.1 hypothetical protein [Ancylobacter sp. Lp-2]
MAAAGFIFEHIQPNEHALDGQLKRMIIVVADSEEDAAGFIRRDFPAGEFTLDSSGDDPLSIAKRWGLSLGHPVVM